MTDGVCIIAYGSRAERALKKCLESVKAWDLPIRVADVKNSEVEIVWPNDPVRQSRWAKVMLPFWSPFDYTLYLDADTIVMDSPRVGFDLLRDGWDFVISYSSRQGSEALWHIEPDERAETIAKYGFDPLQIQAGVFWFRRSTAAIKFFELWEGEWLRWAQFDQAAFLRALLQSPTKLYLLGRPFNGGSVIQHHFGEAS